MRKYSLIRRLFESGSDPYGRNYLDSLPRAKGDPTKPTDNKGYRWEMELRKCINAKAKFYQGPVGDQALDPNEKMTRYGAGESVHGLAYDIGIFKHEEIKAATTRSRNAEALVSRVEVKLFPANYGSLEKNALSKLEFNGSTLTHEVKPDSYFEGKDISRDETVAIFDLMFSKPNTADFLKDLYSHYGITGTSDWVNSLEAIAGAAKVASVKPTLARGSHSGSRVSITGAEWVAQMGKKKDVLIIGDAADYPNCKGTVFALNSKTAAKGLPLWNPSFEFQIKPRLKPGSNVHSLSFEIGAPSVTYSTVSAGGVAFDDNDPNMPDLYSVLMLATDAFDDAEIPDVKSLEDIFQADPEEAYVPGETDPEFLDVLNVSSGGKIGGVTSMVANQTAKDLDLAHKVRKYSIKARLLGKK